MSVSLGLESKTGIMSIGGKQFPILATVVVFLLLFAAGSLAFPNFFSLRVGVNLFRNNAYLGVIAVGMTFVILSGGIDLSVGSVMGFTTIFIAKMIVDYGMNPIMAWGFALLLGMAFGCAMGVLIHYYKLPPFLVTLAGLFMARGMAFVVNMVSVSINSPLYSSIALIKMPLNDRGVSIQAPVFILFAIFIFGLYLAHYTRFGRNVYAIGGNEQSAKLMGLPVASTKIMVYAFSGFCSALAGVVSTLDMYSGDPARGNGLELNAIAAVVIGGTLLTGGVGYVAGTLVGVLIYSTIEMMIDFHGGLDASYQHIAIGALLLFFILMQNMLIKAQKVTRSQL